MNIAISVFLFAIAQIEVPPTTWSTILNNLLIVALSAITTLILTNTLKPVFTRGDDRFKQVEERLIQGDKQRDRLREKDEELKEMIWEQTRQIDALSQKYEELMRIFQMAEVSSSKEKKYLEQIIEIVTNQRK